MKRFILFLAFFSLALPAWGGRKTTVAQLSELLHSLAQDKRSDLEAATALKQIELSEQLTRTTMNGLIGLVNGPLSTEQIYVLEARSANLAPPAAELPDRPAPDAAGQKAVLAKAEAYVTRTYDQLPVLTATKTTLRFQDNLEALASSSGMAGGAKEAVTSFGFNNPAAYVHYVNSTARLVVSERGVEKKSPEKEATKWGANGMTAIREPDPGLGRVFQEAEASETLQWLRWELINGKPAAVYSFTVSKQKSKLALAVCCFPNINQAGIASFYSSTTGPMLGNQGTGPTGVTGNFQTTTEWHEFKANPSYRGRLFIDPDSGVVVRMIVEADLKPSDVVHQLDTRVDFGPVKAGAASFIAPVRSVVNSVVVPNGDSGAGGYSTRCTLLSSEFTDYRVGAGK
jgi:hypothetical protein